MNIKQSLDGVECYRFFSEKQNAKLSLFDINQKKRVIFFMMDAFFSALWCIFIYAKMAKSNLPGR